MVSRVVRYKYEAIYSGDVHRFLVESGVVDIIVKGVGKNMRCGLVRI